MINHGQSYTHQGTTATSYEASANVDRSKPKQLYSKHYFDPAKLLTMEIVKASFADHHHNNKQLITKMLDDMTKMKSYIFDWGRTRVQMMFLKAAQEATQEAKLEYHSKLVSQFSDIGASYASGEPTDEKHNQMLWVLYGFFKAQQGWARKLESDYMNEHNCGYIEEISGGKTKETKGFIECSFTL